MIPRIAPLAAICLFATSAVAQPVPGTEMDTQYKVYSGATPIGDPIFETSYTTRFLGAEGDLVLTELCYEQLRRGQPTCDTVSGQAVLNGVIPVANLNWRRSDGDRAALAKALRAAKTDEGVTLPDRDFLPLTEGKTLTWVQPSSAGPVQNTLTQTCCSSTTSPFGADHEVWTLRVEMTNMQSGEPLGTAALQYDAVVGWVFAQQSSNDAGGKTTAIGLPTDLRLPK
ncbi:hypothetical protein [Antarctobacter jejuensis]|uniref:hypothetical protein n=1 Tax=Antarctobacter jejuensis TaxID=1439938 RepID=UPI003FD2B336